MNSLKQALIQMKTDWQSALLLGCVSTLLVMAVRFIPFGSAFLLSLGLLFLQQVTEYRLKNHSWPRHTDFMSGRWLPMVVCSLILIPTSALLGAATGLLQSPQEMISALPLSLGLHWIAIYFYLIVAHSLKLREEGGADLAKAIDLIAMSSLRQFRSYFATSFYLALAIMVSSLTWGAGYIVVLPLLFFTSSFSYQRPPPK